VHLESVLDFSVGRREGKRANARVWKSEKVAKGMRVM